MSEKKRHFISVIIPTYHDWDKLEMCIKALKEQNYPKKWFEIVIVNNDPFDPFPSHIDLPSNCKVIVEGKPGSYAARNAGVAHAKGDILSFTDSDCKPKQDWLCKINSHYILSDDALSGAVNMFSKKNNNGKLNFSESYDYIYGINQEIYIEKGVAATANLSVRKKDFFLVGGFNDSFLSGGDVDFCKKLKEKGVKLRYRDDVVVFHPLRDNMRTLLIKVRRLLGGKIQASFFWGLLSAFSPPIIRLQILFFKKKAPVCVKIKAAVVLFFIKIYQIVWFPLLLLGLERERR